jgi:hypothetical protein
MEAFARFISRDDHSSARNRSEIEIYAQRSIRAYGVCSRNDATVPRRRWQIRTHVSDVDAKYQSMSVLAK